MSTESIIRKLDLSWDDWTVPFETACLVYDQIVGTKPKTILECGSGNSTVVIMKAIETAGEGTLISLEQSDEHLQGTLQKLRNNDISFKPQLARLKLQPIEVNGLSCYWYEPTFLSSVTTGIQLCLIDGPSIVGRVGALPILWPMLDIGCKLILDDGQRDAESACIKYWEYLFGDMISTSYDGMGRGVWSVVKRSFENPKTLNLRP